MSYHPSHAHGDAVSIRLVDAEHGEFLVAVTPELAENLGTLLVTAVSSPRIGAHADQLRATQRDRLHGR
ncbi:hypothetical protein [Mycolicibacter arupensis]|uniref:Uncharacterized protein n=1 Tax=Mycolicibacter arupensis TaxID=342002 RepID=A0A5C7Y8S7_9MYCO|nr:hypothetical protein [Mycolicibacter arupensis]TXI58280.1 MAG: hypothetical protein E6Q54_05970 [Mycolicibacter arupensis]